VLLHEVIYLIFIFLLNLFKHKNNSFLSITKEENSSLLIADSNLVEDELSAKAFNLPKQISYMAENNQSKQNNIKNLSNKSKLSGLKIIY